MKLNDNIFVRAFLLVLLVLGVTSAAMAQRTVTGTVTDAESGDPLIGASVLVTGTSTGTVTDFDGNYSLNVPANAESITFSYTGYGTQTIVLAGQSVIDIKLSSGELLDEVVVIGYGTTTRKEVTSAITSVKAEDFNVGNINDPTQLIQGKVAGLQISKAGGNPNENATLRLRGVTSFGGNQAPLTIIDGVVGADLSTVDPADIESIDVLKDGSAAAIYGIQASSGVIIVTTKKGKAGKGVVEYRGYATSESIAKAPQAASKQDYLRLVTETVNATTAANNDYGVETDWIDEVTRTALSHVHNLSYSGGAGGTTYRASINYRDIQGIGVVNDGFTQLNARLSLTQKALNDRLTLGVDLTATDRDADFFNTNAFRYAVTYNPAAPIRVDQAGATVNPVITNESLSRYGGYFEIDNFDYFNPVAIARTTSAEQQTRTSLYSFRASYELLDNLTLNTNYSRQRINRFGGFFNTRESRFGGNAAGDSAFRGSAGRNTSENTNDLFEATAVYNVKAGRNNIELLAGYSWQRLGFANFNFDGRGLPTNSVGFNRIQFVNDINEGNLNAVAGSLGTYQEESFNIGFFGRARFNIGDIYNITASVRRDGSSRNGPNFRYEFFPAISASADLVKALDISGLDNLKFRAGYGITGSLPGGAYSYIARFEQSGRFFIDGQPVVAIGPANNPNPDLRFERKGEFNVGLDFAALDYRLTASADFYIRKVTDLLLPNVPANAPPAVRPDLPVEANVDNLELTSSGVELALSYQIGDPASKFSWTPSVTLATYDTRVEDNGVTTGFVFNDGFFVPSSAPGSPGQNDDPMSQLRFGDRFGGIYTRVLDVEASRAEGRYVFVDQDGDGADSRTDPDDKVLVGNGLPTFSLGFQNQFKFGNIDFGFFFRGDFGHSLANLPANFYSQQGNLLSRNIENLVITDRFLEGIVDNPIMSDYFVEKADFLVLDNAQIGINIPMKPSSPFRSLRPYIAGQNLFYITNYTGVDPNVRYNDAGSPFAQGIDRRNTYFRTRSFTVGVSIGL